METLFDFSAIGFFSVYGLAAMVLVLIPNFIFAKKEQKSRPDDVASAGAGICMLELLSRAAITIASVFVRMPRLPDAFGIAAGVVLLLYYFLWLRYFKSGCCYPGIYINTFLGIPVPFAVCNVLYLILTVLWLGNGIALCCAAVFGVCHLTNAAAAMKDLKGRARPRPTPEQI